MIRTVDKRWLPALVLAVGALCFSQVRTVVHIHHSHDSDSLPFELSFHPLDADPDHAPGHHGGKEHHHSFDRDCSRWFLTRIQQSGPVVSQATIAILISGEFSTSRLLGVLSAGFDFRILDDQTTRFSSDPRSPPLMS